MIATLPLQASSPVISSTRQGSTHSRLRGIISLAPTVARIPIATLVVIAILGDAHGRAAVWLGAFVVLDIVDGLIARAIDRETAFRRALDSTIDHVAICTCIAVMTVSHPAILSAGAIIVLRDIIQAGVSAQMIRKHHVVATGRGLHAVYTILVAAWGLVWILRGDSPLWFSWVVGCAGIVTLADYVNSCNSVVARRTEI
ncbi:CDP-alcohol phosphatidyltransferase family protein [Flexivirga oryzae]|uniref:CDP-alcohol phosphatidyltransferase family protein n=1 Tax=Flexivirga oryzae TaxID=1794944 RepID=UPI003CCD0EB9